MCNDKSGGPQNQKHTFVTFLTLNLRNEILQKDVVELCVMMCCISSGLKTAELRDTVIRFYL
jgi:hypothetical protein